VKVNNWLKRWFTLKYWEIVSGKLVIEMFVFHGETLREVGEHAFRTFRSGRWCRRVVLGKHGRRGLMAIDAAGMTGVRSRGHLGRGAVFAEVAE
jgi:hypothetical protein